MRVVMLNFGKVVLLVSGSAYTPWRRNGTYNIQANLDPTGTGVELLETNENLVCVRADAVSPWRDAIGSRLSAVEVYGIGTVPHIIRFVSPNNASPVIAVGYPGPSSPLIGDFSSLLVFSGDEWLSGRTTLHNTWEKIWECRLPSV